MKKVVFYSFFDNYNRCRYIDIWRRNNPQEARNVIFFEAIPGRRHPQAKTLGALFLHSGDPRSIREYEAYYEGLGVPAVNVRSLPLNPAAKPKEAANAPTTRPLPSGIEIIEVSPLVRKSKHKAKGK